MSRRKVIAIDIDGTLIDNKMQKTVDKITGQRYSPAEWEALGPGRYDDMSRWDFTSEWEDKDKNIDSILFSEPIQENIDLVLGKHKQGYTVVYITSRGGGDVSLQEHISAALSQRLGIPLKGYALGDYGTYGKDKLPVKKQRVLQELAAQYDEVIFMDDEEKNLELARQVGGVEVIDALRHRR